MYFSVDSFKKKIYFQIFPSISLVSQVQCAYYDFKIFMTKSVQSCSILCNDYLLFHWEELHVIAHYYVQFSNMIYLFSLQVYTKSHQSCMAA